MNTSTNQKGAVLFAYNTPEIDYLKIAEISAQRIRHFLNLPVTVITNASSQQRTAADITVFDNVIETPETRARNYIQRKLWHNKGRYQAYELSPYQETLLIDCDYIVNSTKLLKLFELESDILIHDNCTYLMKSDQGERLGQSTFDTLWATVIKFNKTTRAEQFFQMLKLVQDNYSYYSHIYHYLDYQFRNDYAATVALKTINGQLFRQEDFIPWKLVHIPDHVEIINCNTDRKIFDTEFDAILTDPMTNRRDYIRIQSFDFHLMDKNNFLRLFNE